MRNITENLLLYSGDRQRETKEKLGGCKVFACCALMFLQWTIFHSFRHHQRILLSALSEYCIKYVNYSNGVEKYKPWRILFFGTDDFSLKSLQTLYDEYKNGSFIQKLDVVTTSNHAVKQYCQKENIRLFGWPPEVESEQYDLAIVVSFGYLIPKLLIEKFPLGILNVHGSLLPRWRGAAPVVHCLLNDDKVTGVSIMKIKPHKFDTGDIVSQVSYKIPPDVKSGALSSKLAEIGAAELLSVIKGLPSVLSTSEPQISVGVTKAPKVDESYSQVKWESVSVDKLRAMYRALDDCYPLWTHLKGKVVKLRKLQSTSGEKGPSAEVLMNNQGDKAGLDPGSVLFNKHSNCLLVRCTDGFVAFDQVCVKGKKPMTAVEFYNGYLSSIPIVCRKFG